MTIGERRSPIRQQYRGLCWTTLYRGGDRRVDSACREADGTETCGSARR
jgi:hypothetical protein